MSIPNFSTIAEGTGGSCGLGKREGTVGFKVILLFLPLTSSGSCQVACQLLSLHLHPASQKEFYSQLPPRI